MDGRSLHSTVIPFVCFAMAKMPHQRVLKSSLSFSVGPEELESVLFYVYERETLT